MHNCEFCSISFHHRPQVKNPRACKDCQKLRQKANELEWKKLNPDCFDKNYHALQRERRVAELIALAKQVTEALGAGCLLLGHQFNSAVIGSYFSKLFTTLGLREINKLWTLKKTIDLDTCAPA